MKETKIQTGLRIPENQYNKIRTISDRMGVSANTLILMLIDIGLTHIEKEPQEWYRYFFRIHLNSDE